MAGGLQRFFSWCSSALPWNLGLFPAWYLILAVASKGAPRYASNKVGVQHDVRAVLELNNVNHIVLGVCIPQVFDG